MIHILTFILKVIASIIIACTIGLGASILTFLMGDKYYTNNIEHFIDHLWEL